MSKSSWYHIVSHYWANEISILGLSWAKVVVLSGQSDTLPVRHDPSPTIWIPFMCVSSKMIMGALIKKKKQKQKQKTNKQTNTLVRQLKLIILTSSRGVADISWRGGAVRGQVGGLTGTQNVISWGGGSRKLRFWGGWSSPSQPPGLRPLTIGPSV